MTLHKIKFILFLIVCTLGWGFIIKNSIMEEKEIVIEVSNGVVVGAYSNYPIKVILLDNDSIDSARTKQESEAFKDSLNGEFKEMKIVEWSDC